MDVECIGHIDYGGDSTDWFAYWLIDRLIVKGGRWAFQAVKVSLMSVGKSSIFLIFCLHLFVHLWRRLPDAEWILS